MQEIVAHNHEFPAQAAANHHGEMVKQTGDDMFAVFSDPIGAVETAIDAQKECNSDEQLGVLPVRIGITPPENHRPHHSDLPVLTSGAPMRAASAVRSVS